MRAGVEIEHEFEHVFAIGDAHEDDVEGAVVEFGARGGEGGLRAPRDVERPHTEDVAGDASPPGTIGEADAEVGVGVMSLVVFPPSRGGFVQEIAPIRATRENAHDGLQREACAA